MIVCDCVFKCEWMMEFVKCVLVYYDTYEVRVDIECDISVWINCIWLYFCYLWFCGVICVCGVSVMYVGILDECEYVGEDGNRFRNELNFFENYDVFEYLLFVLFIYES